MRKILGVLAIMISFVGCDVSVSGDDIFDPPTGNDNLSVEAIKISSGQTYLANTTEYSNSDGVKSEFSKRFTIDSSTELKLRGDGSSYFSVACSTDPNFKEEVVRFDVDGNELSRENLSYNEFQIASGEQVEVQITISGIAEDCMSVSHMFYVSAVDSEE